MTGNGTRSIAKDGTGYTAWNCTWFMILMVAGYRTW